MLNTSQAKTGGIDDTLPVRPQSDFSGYILPDETFRTLQAIGEILRRVHNRLEAEKSASIGIKHSGNVSIGK